MATHSSVLAWRIPGTGEPGGLPSMGSQSRTRLKRLSSSSSLDAYVKTESACGVSYCGMHREPRLLVEGAQNTPTSSPPSSEDKACIAVPRPLTRLHLTCGFTVFLQWVWEILDQENGKDPKSSIQTWFINLCIALTFLFKTHLKVLKHILQSKELRHYYTNYPRKLEERAKKVFEKTFSLSLWQIFLGKVK